MVLPEPRGEDPEPVEPRPGQSPMVLCVVLHYLQYEYRSMLLRVALYYCQYWSVSMAYAYHLLTPGLVPGPGEYNIAGIGYKGGAFVGKAVDFGSSGSLPAYAHALRCPGPREYSWRVETMSQGLVCCPICLRACYAMPGTDPACDAISLCASCAMSGTYNVMGEHEWREPSQVSFYAPTRVLIPISASSHLYASHTAVSLHAYMYRHA
eukprot:3063654-Rhodomonas_salina.5